MTVGSCLEGLEKGLVAERKTDAKLSLILTESFLVPAGKDQVVLYGRLGVVERDVFSMATSRWYIEPMYPNLRHRFAENHAPELCRGSLKITNPSCAGSLKITHSSCVAGR